MEIFSRESGGINMKWIELWAMLEVIGAIIGIITLIGFVIYIFIDNRKNK